jgi:hypothetical protein
MDSDAHLSIHQEVSGYAERYARMERLLRTVVRDARGHAPVPMFV